MILFKVQIGPEPGLGTVIAKGGYGMIRYDQFKTDSTDVQNKISRLGFYQSTAQIIVQFSLKSLCNILQESACKFGEKAWQMATASASEQSSDSGAVCRFRI